MHQAYLEINGVRTLVSTWGKWVEESIDENEDIVLIIPGNPGVTGFYDVFAETIHEKLGYSVWIVGHAGHNLPKERITPLPNLKDHEDLYGLKGQIEHKIEFIKKYIPKTARLHLVGHSIGSYMILELLDDPGIKNRNITVSDIYLLFPTIELMSTSKNGLFICNYVKHIVWLIVFLAWIFTILPSFLQFVLLYGYMTVARLPIDQHFKNIKDLVKPGVLKRVFFLCYEEMDQVKVRNDAVIKRNINKIRLFYGAEDGWAPQSYYEKIKADIPNVDALLSSFDHSFVLHESQQVGQVVCDWLKAKQ